MGSAVSNMVAPQPQSASAQKLIVDTLRKTPLMDLLNEAVPKEMLDCFQILKFACGAPIKSSQANQFFIVAEGSVDIACVVAGSEPRTKQATELLCQRTVGDYVSFAAYEQLLAHGSREGHYHGSKKKATAILDISRVTADATTGCTLLRLHRERFALMRARMAARKPNMKNTARFSGGKRPARAGSTLTGAEKSHLMNSIVESEVTNYLMDIPFLEGVEEAQLLMLAHLCSYMMVRRGDVLCQEGELGDRFFICIRGSLQATAKVLEVPSTSSPTNRTAVTPVNAIDKHIQSLKRIGTGSYFGEISLLFKIPRIATITALSDSLLVYIERSAFCNFFKIAPEASVVLMEHVRLHFLDTLVKLGCAFLGAIPPVKLQELSFMSELLEHPVGTSLLTQGQTRSAFYILLKGEVQTTYESVAHSSTSIGLNDLQNHEKEVISVRPGGYFGHEAIILGKPSLVTAKATTHCLTLKLTPESFEEFFLSIPEVYSEFCIRCLRDKVGIEHVMHHYELHKLWAADCIGRGRNNEVSLFEQMEDFKWETDFTEDGIHDRALVIYMRYIAATASNPVPMSLRTVEAIEEELSSETVGATIFRYAREELLNSLDDEAFFAFKNSRAFHQFLATMQCPVSIYSQLNSAQEELLSMRRKPHKGRHANERDDTEIDDIPLPKVAFGVNANASTAGGTMVSTFGRGSSIRSTSNSGANGSLFDPMSESKRRKTRLGSLQRKMSTSFVY